METKRKVTSGVTCVFCVETSDPSKAIIVRKHESFHDGVLAQDSLFRSHYLEQTVLNFSHDVRAEYEGYRVTLLRRELEFKEVENVKEK